ncbi:MAG: M48 family metalloprotease [Desulfovibrio sp.]|nr:M48 family metalloprotease [Desulfovibrio sp.]
MLRILRSAARMPALALLILTAAFPRPALAWGEFTIKDEKELGEKFNVLIRSRLPLVQDTEIVSYAQEMVNRLANTMPKQPFPFTVSVIRHNAINAFASPGGYIFVFTGLILAMNHEAEAAGVIAHEMAHVTQRHIASRIENSQIISLLSVLGMLAGALMGGSAQSATIAGSLAAGQAAMLNYSRADEREADQVGMNYLSQAGYPPAGMVGAFQILSRRQWLLGGNIPSYLSTHPALAERVKDMQVRVSLMPEQVRNRKNDDARFLRVQALIRARYGDIEPAQRVFAGQMQGATRCMALMGMGILCSRQNRIKDAAGYFESALTCNPDDGLIVREAGSFHYLKGNKTQGGNLLRRAVGMNPNDTYALYYYARNLREQGRTGEATEYALRLLRKEPEDQELHELLAHLYGDEKKMFEANLHMAYSALYANNKTRVRQFHEKSKGLAQTPQEKQILERFEQRYKERREFW